MKSDIIIIGAGAAGLMAAYVLSKAGKKVLVLEARDRIGGRIHTISNGDFSQPVELGAEFVHGDLPVTLGLLEEAAIGTTEVGFETWQHHCGKFERNDEFVEGWDTFLEKLNDLEQDMPIKDFTEKEFPGDRYSKMRGQIENYVSGYDTADIQDASAFALRNEWNHEDEDAQHRVEGGYSRLIDFLADCVRKAGSTIITNAEVEEVSPNKEGVNILTAGGAAHEADKVVVAVPLGVSKAPAGVAGAIRFSPVLPEQMQAFDNIGYGAVIKIILEFTEMFWESNSGGADLCHMGFLFSDEQVPTYWTQSPGRIPILTGWLGGPPADAKKSLPNDAVLDIALTSLENIFGKGLREKLVASRVANWNEEPFTRGSYAYDKVQSPDAKTILNRPVKNRIYFAGEYLYDGPAIGTVEAALTSGRDVAETILRHRP